MKASSVRKCPWNPRKMSRSARKALESSIDEFDDISGIVIDANTNELICGNHRYTSLQNKYGKDTLELVQLQGEFFGIYSNDEFVNYVARVVNWSEEKIISANITANNQSLTGEFTSGLQVQLSKLNVSLDAGLARNLKLDDLTIDLSMNDSLDFELDLEQDSKYSSEASRILEEEASDIVDSEDETVKKETLSLIKVSIPDELKDEVKMDLLEFLAKQDYYEQINVV